MAGHLALVYQLPTAQIEIETFEEAIPIGPSKGIW
jgi:hypothetical protein